MVLAFHMILQDHLTQSQAALLVGATQVTHQPAKFGGHRFVKWSRKTTWIKGTLSYKGVLWVGARQGKLPSCQVWWPQALW